MMSTCDRLESEAHTRVLTDYAPKILPGDFVEVMWSLLFIGHLASLYEWLGTMRC